MLVGDPQQLKPVILLDELTNRKLRRKYHVADEYDYRENSIYKTYLACDAVSDEILCEIITAVIKIIDFNNKNIITPNFRCSLTAGKDSRLSMSMWMAGQVT